MRAAVLMQPPAVRLQASCRLDASALRTISANDGYPRTGGNRSGTADANGSAEGGRKAPPPDCGGELCSDVTHHGALFFTSHLLASSQQKHLRVVGKVDPSPDYKS